MLTKNFSVKEALLFSVKAFAARFGFFFRLALIFAGIYASIVLLMGVIAFIESPGSSVLENAFFNPAAPAWVMAVTLGFHILLYIIEEFYYYVILNACLSPQIHTTTSQAFNVHASDFSRYLLARWGYYLKIFLGFVLLIIPGIYVMVRSYFTAFPLVDKTAATIHDDAQQADALTAGIRGKLFFVVAALTLATIVIGFVVIPLGVGFLTTSLRESTRMLINLGVWHILLTLLSPLRQLFEVSLYRQLQQAQPATDV